MVRIVRAKVRADVPQLSDEAVQSLGQRLYARAESAAEGLTELEEKGVELDVRDGSIDIVTIVLSTAASVYAALTIYDGFWSAVERLRSHAKQVGEAISHESVDEAHNVGGSPLSTNVTYGHLDKLHRIHRALEAGQIDSETAVSEVVRTLRTADDPVTAETISQIERAMGAKPKGLTRLTEGGEMVERRWVDRAIGSGAPGEPRPVKKRARRLTIRRRPGELAPRAKFDS